MVQNPNAKSHTQRNLGIAAVVIIGILILAVLALPSIFFRQIEVSGTVITNGIGTHATRIDFSASSGILISAQVNNGSYSASLQNGQDYKVTVDWSGLLGSTGSCNGGGLNLNVLAFSDTYNTNC